MQLAPSVVRTVYIREGERPRESPSFGKHADRGNSALTLALSPRRGGYGSSPLTIAFLVLPFSTVRAPMVTKGRLTERESAAEQARRWRRTIRARHLLHPLLGERVG